MTSYFRRKRFIYIRTGPAEEIITGTKIVLQFLVLYRCVVNLALLLRVFSKTHSLSLEVVERHHRTSMPVDFILVPSKAFRKSTCNIRHMRNALRNLKNLFLSNAPTLYFSRQYLTYVITCIFTHWPTSRENSLPWLIIGLSRNRTRKT